MTSDYSTKFNPDVLREMIRKGKSAKEIRKKLGIANHTLKEHLFLLNKQDKTEYEISGMKEEEEQAERLIKRRKGYICAFNSDCLPDFKFADAFEMSESDGRVVLKKIK